MTTGGKDPRLTKQACLKLETKQQALHEEHEAAALLATLLAREKDLLHHFRCAQAEQANVEDAVEGAAQEKADAMAALRQAEVALDERLGAGDRDSFYQRLATGNAAAARGAEQHPDAVWMRGNATVHAQLVQAQERYRAATVAHRSKQEEKQRAAAELEEVGGKGGKEHGELTRFL
jgi:hypothetical protein